MRFLNKHNQGNGNQFHMPVCRTLLLLMGFICLAGSPLTGFAQNRNTSGLADASVFSTKFEVLFDHLTRLPVLKSSNMFNKYYPVIAREIDMGNLYTANLKELNDLLDIAVSESVDVLTLFTHPVVQQNKVLVLDKKTLMAVNRRFNLHALFLFSSSTVKGDMVQMKFLLFGQKKLIIGYDKNATIKHPDYSFATGYYNYKKLFIMEAGTDSQNNFGLFKIRGMSAPNGKFKPMRGPLNASVSSLSFIFGTNKKKKVLVKYQWIGIGKKVVDRIPIESIGRGN